MHFLPAVILISACLQAQTESVPARPPVPLPQIKQNCAVQQMFVDAAAGAAVAITMIPDVGVSPGVRAPVSEIGTAPNLVSNRRLTAQSWRSSCSPSAFETG